MGSLSGKNWTVKDMKCDVFISENPGTYLDHERRKRTKFHVAPEKKGRGVIYMSGKEPCGIKIQTSYTQPFETWSISMEEW